MAAEFVDLAKKGLIYVDPNGGVWVSDFSKSTPTDTQLEDLNSAQRDTIAGGNLRVPSGVVMRCNVVPIDRTRRTKAFDFIEREGTYIQDNLMESSAYPLEIYFLGEAHATAAEAFERALALSGPGTLQLPLDVDQGGRRVLPMKYKRTNRMLEGVNRTVFEVQFRKTTPPSPKTLDLGAGSAAEALLAAQKSVETFNLIQDNPTRVEAKITEYVSGISSEMQSYVNKFNETKNSFDSILTSLDTSIALVFSKPLTVASQLQKLLTTPRFTALTDSVTAYKNVISSVTDAPTTLFSGVCNVLGIQALIGMTACTVMMDETLSADYLTRQQAVDAFADAKAEYEAFLEYLTGQEERTAELDLDQRFRIDPTLYEQQYRYLIESSGNVDTALLGLRQEATFTAPQDTTSLQLADKHYPVEFAEDHISAIALFERTNSLTGDDILLIQKGTEYKVLI